MVVSGFQRIYLMYLFGWVADTAMLGVPVAAIVVCFQSTTFGSSVCFCRNNYDISGVFEIS